MEIKRGVVYRGITLYDRTTIISNYVGYDITVHCVQMIGSDGTLHNMDDIEIWDHITGDPIVDGLHFNTVADAIAWINI